MAITVMILINQDPIVVCQARNMSEKNEHGETKYLTSDNEVIWHRREDRAVPLAIKMLQKEIKWKIGPTAKEYFEQFNVDEFFEGYIMPKSREEIEGKK